MARWLLGRLLQGGATLACALVVIFLLVRIAPGDPLAAVHADTLAPEARAALLARYGLDRPVPAQLMAFLRGVARGDLGVSIADGRPVTEHLLHRAGPTLALTGTSLLLALVLGAWLGVLQARRAGSTLDRLLGTASIAAYTVPSYWLALLLVWVVAVQWHLLPAAGARDPRSAAEGLGALADGVAHLVLPVAALVLSSLGLVMRQQRAALLEALGRPFVTAARARGLSEARVVWGHAWRSTLPPLAATAGILLPTLVTGAVFVESVFAWPGIGSLAATAAMERDAPVVVGAAIVAGVAVLVGSLAADLVARLAAPDGS